MITRLKTQTPVWWIAFAFLLTVSFARLISLMDPKLHIELSDGRHIHHYVIGIFVLTGASYLAMIFKGPRATFWIALLYGFAVGLTFDEFGMWLNLRTDFQARWNSSGLVIVITALLACIVMLALRRLAAASLSEPRQDNHESLPEPASAFSPE